jgi:hypothetical protein
MKIAFWPNSFHDSRQECKSPNIFEYYEEINLQNYNENFAKLTDVNLRGFLLSDTSKSVPQTSSFITSLKHINQNLMENAINNANDMVATTLQSKLNDSYDDSTYLSVIDSSPNFTLSSKRMGDFEIQLSDDSSDTNDSEIRNEHASKKQAFQINMEPTDAIHIKNLNRMNHKAVQPPITKTNQSPIIPTIQSTTRIFPSPKPKSHMTNTIQSSPTKTTIHLYMDKSTNRNEDKENCDHNETIHDEIVDDDETDDNLIHQNQSWLKVMKKSKKLRQTNLTENFVIISKKRKSFP